MGVPLLAITFFETKWAIVRSVMRLTMASMTRASSALPASSDRSPTSRSGESSPTAAAMLRSIGSTRSASFFETAETTPRIIRMTEAAFAATPPSVRSSTVAISSMTLAGSAAMRSNSAIALSSSAIAPPDTQWATIVSQLADLPPLRSRRTSA